MGCLCKTRPARSLHLGDATLHLEPIETPHSVSPARSGAERERESRRKWGVCARLVQLAPFTSATLPCTWNPSRHPTACRLHAAAPSASVKVVENGVSVQDSSSSLPSPRRRYPALGTHRDTPQRVACTQR